MGQAEKKTKGSTPGRPKKKGTQFWDIGKVGRKTGITLPDKGIRDEHGLEPVSHVFSSPASPQRTFASSEVNMQESSGPDVDKTLNSRKTPRLPPPRASTPKHTNIGSPRRSTGRPISQRLSVGLEADGSPGGTRTQPPPNRVLDFGEGGVRKSIESPSPFKPKHVLRRSMGARHENPFANGSPVRTVKPSNTILEEDKAERDRAEADLPVDDGPIMLDDDDYYDALPQQDENHVQEELVEEEVPVKRKPGRPRRSGGSLNRSQVQNSPPNSSTTIGQKRTRSSLNGPGASDASVSNSLVSDSSRPSKRGRTSREDVIVHQDDGDIAVDPSDIAHGDEYVVEIPDESTEPPAKAKGKGKKSKGKGKAPQERDPNRAMGTRVKINDSPSKLRYNRESRESSRGLSVGPVSNVHLRASTPFEDAGERTSRFGRALIQPLKYWANEMRIYKHGETAGIVRADEVSPPKRKKPAKKRGRKKQLDGIDEESDTESTHPDEWEEEVGVIAGMVANWDPETQMGLCEQEDLVREDLAFAHGSIVTRDVAGSEFKYAKIMTLPFFGSGIVELPPEGFKRAKNSSKMQMCFFVHEGKVMVEVGGATAADTNQFAISKGGVWVVPRGNKYAITNESRTKTARLFFAQGCEMEAMQVEE